MILYNLRKTSDGFMFAKFGPDFNVEAVYHLTAVQCGVASIVNYNCDCPAGGRPSCKHRKMLTRMIPKADSDEFYCYETQSWHKPLAPTGVEPMQDKLDAFYATIEEVAGSDIDSGPKEILELKGPWFEDPKPFEFNQVETKTTLFGKDGIMEPPIHKGVPVREVESLPTPTEPPTFRRRV